jgi:hypothetical protein
VKKGALAIGGIAILVAGAIVVASSVGAGGGKGPYRFDSGVYVVDQSSFARVYVENLTNDEIVVGVKFAGEDKESLNIGAGDEVTATGTGCMVASCAGKVEIISKTPLIVPTLRYTDSTGELQEHLGGAFVVTRDGKRVP